jgi:drug/metabolite transporter (DMT)-like permease
MTTVNPRMSAQSWALLLLLSLLWGGSFLFIKIAVVEIPPATIAAARVAIAAAAIFVVLRVGGGSFPAGRRLWLGLVLLGGINNTIPFFLINWGQQHIDIGLAGILNGTTPLFTVLLVPLFSNEERITPARLGGVLLGLAGVAILVGPGALRGIGAGVWGALAVVLGSLGYAFGAIIARRFTALPPLTLAFGQLAGASLFSLPLALLLDAPWTLRPGMAAIGAVLMLALACSAFAYLIFFRVLKAAGATNASPVTLLIPITATGLGALVFGERLGIEALGGFALIALGIALVDGRIKLGR